MVGPPPPHTGSHSHSLHFTHRETEAQRCKDLGKVTQAVEGRNQGMNPVSRGKLGPLSLSWVTIRPLGRGQGTRRSSEDQGQGGRLQSTNLTDEGQRAGVSAAEWACGFGSIPALALPAPVCSLPGEQAGWTDGWGEQLWRDGLSWLPPVQEEVATLLSAESGVRSPSAILFCFIQSCSAFFWSPKMLREGQGGKVDFRKLERDLCFSEAQWRRSALGQRA